MPRLVLLRTLTCALLLLPTRAAAQYRVDAWTTDSGLPVNSVTSVLQTRDGFIWLSTYGGLVRFDGNRFLVFTADNAPGLRTGRLVELTEDRDGALWMRTEGLGLSRYHRGTFTSYTTADGLPSNQIGLLHADADGLVAETDVGAAIWRGDRFERRASMFRHPDGDAVPLGVSPSGAWVRTATRLDRLVNGRVTASAPLVPNAISAYEDRSGRLWLQLRDGEDNRTRRLARYHQGRLVEFGTRDGVPAFGDIRPSEDRDGRVWFGLRGNAGLLMFDGARFVHVTPATGLPGANVERVFQDREGTVWAPTDGGLARLTARPLLAYGRSDGLDADNAYVVAEAGGDLFAGTWPGLARYRNGRFTSISRTFDVAGRNVTAIAEARDGAVWIGTWDAGLRRMANGVLTSWPSPVGTVVRAIHQGREHLWIGGTTGIARHAGREGAARVEGFPGGEVLALYEDRRGALWIGTDAGVVRYDGGRFTTFTGADAASAPPLVRAIHEDDDGTLWFGTYDSGLLRFKHNRFTRIGTREGLYATGAFRIIEDGQRRFWISSNQGIYRVARDELNAVADGRTDRVTSVAYGTRDGMRHAECNGGAQPAGVLAHDGRIWFPTQAGVVVLDPTTIPVNTQPPPVVITEVSVGHQAIGVSDRVEIASGPTAFEARFAALTFVRPELTRFRFRMEGVDPRWIEGGAEGAARYAQLPYGRFVFRVIAANRDGVWNQEGVHLPVVVVPPFYRTTWFLFVSIASTAAAGFGVHRWRLKLLRREQDLQTAFSRRLIDSQEIERKRIAAGLHDGLQQTLLVIRNWALLGLMTPAGARTRLQEIEGAAAQALGEVRAIVHDLTPTQLERFGLARALADMIETVAEAARIPFACDVAALERRLPAVTELSLFRVVQEAVTNIVKHSGARSASLRATAQAGLIHVEIRDDGRGFDTAPRERSHSPGPGLGLFGMAERVEMIGGRLNVASQPGAGTVVTIVLSMPEAAP